MARKNQPAKAKGAPKPGPAKKPDKFKNMKVMTIQAGQLKRGDQIVTKVDKHSGRIVSATKVEDLSLCEGKWRTHFHVNKTQCYDERQYIRIAVPGKTEEDEMMDYLLEEFDKLNEEQMSLAN